MLAPAKLTVSLRVTGVRPDGYHELDAEMVTLDLADELVLREGGTALAVSAGDGVRTDGLPGAGQNLVERALAACGRTAAVQLMKRIPLGGGLGGGSADAAAVLRWAGCADPGVALRLGSDVPFCLVGGRARVVGVGERVTPLPFAARDYLLLLPPFGVDTASVYRAWDEEPRDDAPNALTHAALAVEPRLAGWRDALRELTGAEPTLAGSGSTWFVEGRRPRRTSCAWGPRRPGWCAPARCRRAGRGTERRAGSGGGSYLPARRCQRVAFSIFLCFFLRIRLRRFLISDPMSSGRLAVPGVDCQVGSGVRRQHGLRDRAARPRATGHAAGPGSRGRGVLRRAPGPDAPPEAGAAGRPRRLLVRRGAVALHLGVEDDFRPARKAHPALVVRDLPALEAALAAAGVEVRPNPDLAPGGGAYVDDPFGNRIEFVAEG